MLLSKNLKNIKLKNSFTTSLMLNYDLTALIAVADPDPPQISGDGGGGVGHQTTR